MFYDLNLTNIFKRATGIDQDALDILTNEYIRTSSSLLTDAVIDFHKEHNTLPENLNTLESITKFIEQSLTNPDPELIEYLQDKMVKFNADFVKTFCEIASPGDVMYLKVYLASSLASSE